MKKILFILTMLLFAVQAWGANEIKFTDATDSSITYYDTFAALNSGETLADDDIVDLQGNIIYEMFTPDAGGSDGHRVIIQNGTIHGGGVLDDTGWTLSGGEYSRAATTEITVLGMDGVRINEGTAGSLNLGEWDWVSNVLYIKDNPAGHTFDYGIRSRCIDLYRSYVTIKDITFKYSSSWGIESNGDYVSIENCVFDANKNQGVYFDDPGKTNLSVTGCTFTQNGEAARFRGSDYITFSNNTVMNNGGKFNATPTDDSILLIDKDTTDCDNVTVQNNVFSNNSDYSVGCTGSSIVVYSCATTGIISGNIISNEGGAGILLEAGGGGLRSGITVEANTILDSYAGIAAVEVTNAVIKNNYLSGFILSSGSHGIWFKGACTGGVAVGNVIINAGKTGQTTSGGIRYDNITDDNPSYNNTIINCENGIIFTQIGGVVAGAQTIKNNIIKGSINSAFIVSAGSTSPTETYNSIFGNGALGLTLHVSDLTTDPLLVQTWKLREDSPALGEGADIEGINDGGELDIAGNAARVGDINIGAYYGYGMVGGGGGNNMRIGGSGISGGFNIGGPGISLYSPGWREGEAPPVPGTIDYDDTWAAYTDAWSDNYTKTWL